MLQTTEQLLLFHSGDLVGWEDSEKILHHISLSLLKKSKLLLLSGIERSTDKAESCQVSGASLFLLTLYSVKEKESEREFSLCPSNQPDDLALCFCKAMENAQCYDHLGELLCPFCLSCTLTLLPN